jgi:preprotein translocase subunit SecA
MAAAGAGAADGYAEDEMPVMPAVEQRRVDESEQVGRNDPCWCGSGKKFKKCHGA